MGACRLVATMQYPTAAEVPGTHQQDSTGNVAGSPRRSSHACRFRPIRSLLGGAIDRLFQPLQLAVQLIGATRTDIGLHDQ